MSHPAMTALSPRPPISAQHASRSRNNCATSTDATAAIAVRAECTKTGHNVHSVLSLASSRSLSFGMISRPLSADRDDDRHGYYKRQS